MKSTSKCCWQSMKSILLYLPYQRLEIKLKESSFHLLSSRIIPITFSSLPMHPIQKLAQGSVSKEVLLTLTQLLVQVWDWCWNPKTFLMDSWPPLGTCQRMLQFAIKTIEEVMTSKSHPSASKTLTWVPVISSFPFPFHSLSLFSFWLLHTCQEFGLVAWSHVQIQMKKHVKNPANVVKKTTKHHYKIMTRMTSQLMWKDNPRKSNATGSTRPLSVSFSLQSLDQSLPIVSTIYTCLIRMVIKTSVTSMKSVLYPTTLTKSWVICNLVSMALPWCWHQFCTWKYVSLNRFLLKWEFCWFYKAWTAWLTIYAQDKTLCSLTGFPCISSLVCVSMWFSTA